MEFDEDEWIIDSLKRYKQLFMFELQTPANILEWEQGGGGVYVTGKTVSDCTELSLMSLPEKLYSIEGDENLAAGRDFKIVCGVVSSHPIISLKHVPVSNVVAAANGNGSVHLWQREAGDSDLLRAVGVLTHTHTDTDTTSPSSQHNHHYLDWCPDAGGCILSAVSGFSPQLSLLDIETGKSVWQRTAQTGELVLHGATYCGPHLIATCYGEGLLSVMDTREDQFTTGLCSEHGNGTVNTVYSLAVSGSGSVMAAVVSSQGNVSLYDIRCPTHPVTSVITPTTLTRGQVRKPHVQFSYHDTHLLSLSGLHSGVSVYNTKHWNDSNEGHTPFFTHDGHEAMSNGSDHPLSHLWCPNDHSLLISSSSNGSLHAWQYNNIS